jgi:murein DD-endopeptidase MepM/ murein hydrolase activator NlpD
MDNSEYYYDPESCRFVKKKQETSRALARYTWLAVVCICMVGLGIVGMSYFVNTPQELVLQAQNERLSNQLSKATDRMKDFSQELEELSTRDRKLYRTLLQTQPIPEDVRQVGVGGSSPYRVSSGDASTPTSLVQKAGATLDRLERQIALQNASYRELLSLANNRSNELEQLPAILPANGRVVSGYGMRRHPIYKTMRMHEGIDIITRVGTPVFATGDGIVTYADVGPGYGKHVRIRHPQTDYETLYAHLSEISDDIREGSEVERGEEIGVTGNSGMSTGPHLHYEVRNSDGNSLNPVHFFATDMTPRRYKEVRNRASRHQSSLD